MKVVACIPCLNTGTYIKDIVERALCHVDQVIVVNDGSHDNTCEAATEAGGVVINHRTNQGYGQAIRSCVEAAKASGADVLVILDGDGQHDPDEIPSVLRPILKGEADLVIGSRFVDEETAMPLYRRFGIRVITFLFNFGHSAKVLDTQSGFRAYSSVVFEKLHISEKGMSASIETIEQARRNRTTIREVPISCFYPPTSRLNLHAIRHGLGIALTVIRVRFKATLFREATWE